MLLLKKLYYKPQDGCKCFRRLLLTGPSFLKKKINVCIEGNIGSGKTTCLEYFRKFEKLVEINEEPVHVWRQFKGHNPLAILYQDPKRYSFMFQSLVLTTLKETHSKPQTKPLRLMERSLYSAMYCFIENQLKSGYLTDMEYAVLSEIFQFMVKDDQLKIDFIVYLKTSPEVCHERILRRQRHEEQNISLTYLEGLHRLHEEWLIKQGSKDQIHPPLLVIDGNQDKKTMESEFKNVLHLLNLRTSPAT